MKHWRGLLLYVFSGKHKLNHATIRACFRATCSRRLSPNNSRHFHAHNANFHASFSSHTSRHISRHATNHNKIHSMPHSGSSGEAVKNEGRVLHHLCWADDLYATAGTMDHLTRILEDMTNAIERLGMQWKEKPHPLLLDFSLACGGRHEALGTGLDNRGCSEASMQFLNRTPCFVRRRLCSAIPNYWSRSVLTPST